MFTALQNVVPSHLMDRQLHDFAAVRATGLADPQGDKAFDPESFAPKLGAVRFVD
jgi:tRNA 2-thiocytidine biosynthesis protein TtcA